MAATRDFLIPRLAAQPWLEKPPLNIWLIAGLGRLVGSIDEAVARWPSALAALALCLIVGQIAALGSRNPRMGRLAGMAQATTLWTLLRGRLAEPDIFLAALAAAAMLALAALRAATGPASSPRHRLLLPYAFFLAVGASGLVKGTAFGPALILSATAALLLWDRDWPTFKALLVHHPATWLLGALVALAWPLAVLVSHPEALSLWVHHVADRLGATSRSFASEAWGQYLLAPLWQTLPWTPLALVGAWQSLKTARRDPQGPDRLLLCWALVPALLISLASVRNAHYLVPALAPWSVWAATRLSRLQDRLNASSPSNLSFSFARHHAIELTCLSLAAAVGLSQATLGPRFDRRGPEWQWYAQVGQQLEPATPLILVYSDWDKAPYETPFGPVPADLPARLFYLDRPASTAVTWHRDPRTIQHPTEGNGPHSFALIARERDRETLEARLGHLEVLSRSPNQRWDRTYTLYRRLPQNKNKGHAVPDSSPPSTPQASNPFRRHWVASISPET